MKWLLLLVEKIKTGILSKITFVILLLLFMFVLFFSIGFAFLDAAIDTTYLTNIGFAIFAGLASVCFSWSRTVRDEAYAEAIVLTGERSLTTGIIFLFASAFKYAYFFTVKYGKKGTWVLNMWQWIYGFLFLIAILSILITFMDLIFILRTRLTRKKDFMSDIRDSWGQEKESMQKK